MFSWSSIELTETKKVTNKSENRLEKAAADPEGLSQDDIIQNIDSKEWQRLSKVRNIGIAVCLVNVNWLVIF